MQFYFVFFLWRGGQKCAKWHLHSMTPPCIHVNSQRAVPEIILRGGWAANTFLSGGGRCFVDNVSKGWGMEG